MAGSEEANEIEAARRAIDEVDREMAELFASRMEAVKRIAAYKGERGLPVHDIEREADLLERNAALIIDEIKPHYLRFLESALEASRQYQRQLLQGARIAYSGVEGAFAWVAASRAFPGADLVAYQSFKKAYDAVVAGDCDCAVLPLENSEAGEVGQVMDLLFNGPLHANRLFTVPVVQNLLGLPGSDLSTIKTVTSHSQAIAQCSEYLAEHGWETREAPNTAVAAKSLLEAGDSSIAAIASLEAAELYGLKVLDHDINASSDNTTRFVVLSRTGSQDPTGRFILMFTVKNEAGALAKAINVVGAHGFNMTALRSRPMASLAWQYYFLIEAEGDPSSDAGEAMMRELEEQCDRLRIVGRFPAKDPLDQREIRR